MIFLSAATFLAVLLIPAFVDGSGLRRLAEGDVMDMHAEGTTLSKIEERGKLLCGGTENAGFANLLEDGTYEGFEVDLVSQVLRNNNVMMSLMYFRD